jgi:tyrosinase
MTMALSPAEDAWRSLFHGYVEPRAVPAGAAPGTAAPAPQVFRFFSAEDQAAAVALADEFDALAGRQPGKDHPMRPTQRQLEAVMDRFHEAAADNVGLAQAGLRRFIARWPNADVLPMPTLRQQLATLKREDPERFETVRRAAAAAAAVASEEDVLRYYRQDLDLSDHHLHWHALYSWSQPVQGMQGRLFLYMHQQMLARYNTDRLAVGLPPVVPFLSWDEPTTWKAAFSDKTLPADALAPWITAFWVKDGVEDYIAFDEKGHSPAQNAGAAEVTTVLNGLQRVYNGIKARSYPNYDSVGADLEASNPHPDSQAGPHNMGHDVLSKAPNHDQRSFVMVSPEVAMTTPVFYRWHRAIDDYGFAWQESQGPDNADYVTPPVVLRRGAAPADATRSPDVILTPRSAITDIEAPNFSLDDWGETHFGGAGFESPADAALDLAELATEIKQDPDVPGLSMLSIQTDWVYFLRLHNTGATDVTVTVRIWLAARDLAADRRNWIEMDKFLATVPAGAKKVVPRGGWQSTVVRRKSVDEPMTLAETKDEFDDVGPPTDESGWCECGLPYRLLLPRGTAAGMPARFLVLLTDADQDGTAELATPQCGSVQFCGRTNNVWPDNQEMGFPFHRPFGPPGGALDDPVFAHFDPMPNVAWRDISIRCLENA